MDTTTMKAYNEDTICTFLLLKLAMRCNMNCTYCYWFRDATVYDKPALLTPEAEAALLTRLEEHIEAHQLDSFVIIFHGGEPLLFGKSRFDALCTKLGQLERRSGCDILLGLTTNGLLVDVEWARLLALHRVDVTLSIDGPRRVHDSRRLDLKQHGTFDRVMAALPLLRDARIEPSVIAVCDPREDPAELFDFFVNGLGIRQFDVLMPDATHEDAAPPSVAGYYKRLFDAWYKTEDVQLQAVQELAEGLLGVGPGTDSLGHKPVTLVTMLTDGSLEPDDVLRIAGDGSTRTRMNIFEHGFHAIQADPLWREVYEASTTLPSKCQRCPYVQACGGGHIASRWSKSRRYDNPSVYCEDIKDILRHIWSRMLPDLHVESRGRRIPLADAIGPGTHPK
jgi:uncharacterized protein